MNIFSKAINTLSHQGPDAQKSIRIENIILGHVRLSILDLSSNSDQPFLYDKYCMVYNGEIFNYLELKKSWRYWATALTHNLTRRWLSTLFRNGGKIVLSASMVCGRFAYTTSIQVKLPFHGIGSV